MSDQDKRLGVYFHIPFCASKCAYCDFCSLPGRDKLMPYYQDALLIQLQETMPRMTDYFIDTVYFGGGTPSYYGARRIVDILQELKVTNRLMKQSEITVECNPDSVRRKELRMLRKEGVNRLSIGAQSANDDILRLIGRRHNWRQVEMAVKRARKAGFRNVSLDLIYGLPSQTREDWADTLTKALALKPAHISCYGLRLEEGTPMYDEYEGTDNVREYISGVLGDKGIIAEEEELTPFDRASEYLMLGMRTAAGISREEYRSVYQSSFDKLEEMLEVFQENGWAVCDNGRWHFTPGGFLVSNVLIGVLLESQTKEKFNANPWIREAFEARGQKVPLPTASEPYMN